MYFHRVSRWGSRWGSRVSAVCPLKFLPLRNHRGHRASCGCLLAFRIRLAIQLLNQDDNKGAPATRVRAGSVGSGSHAPTRVCKNGWAQLQFLRLHCAGTAPLRTAKNVTCATHIAKPQWQSWQTSGKLWQTQWQTQWQTYPIVVCAYPCGK